MELDITARGGREDLPVCIFIHGLGMNKAMWAEPSDARIMAGLFPLSLMLRDYQPPYRTLFHDMADMGHSVITWSQLRPVGPIDEAVEELKSVFEFAKCIPHKGFILIGHSRGGLIAKSFLKKYPPVRKVVKKERKMFSFSGRPEVDEEFRALVTISTPHAGSNMARWAASLSALASHLTSRVPEGERGRFGEAFNKILNFIQSAGVRELLPGSETLKALETFKPDLDYLLSAGGIKPALFELYGIEVPQALEKIIPEKLFPEEMKAGSGDGLVSLKSSIMPYSAEHLEFPANHAGILVDPALRKDVSDRIVRLIKEREIKLAKRA